MYQHLNNLTPGPVPVLPYPLQINAAASIPVSLRDASQVRVGGAADGRYIVIPAG
ncbi:hypothetical protein GCM10007392_47930 [Saccharospirillum salsuginis]|uniref:Uncharacterized protein n=1 Tax=Saccharospirillum salsuginis TaxID=418750 RepID=A0A918KTA9_9GAMM|nr:hypothetical protein GCM10007392_47930 [Saccharospirillum salsuginis]